jgi:hypothetical protein
VSRISDVAFANNSIPGSSIAEIIDIAVFTDMIQADRL